MSLQVKTFLEIQLNVVRRFVMGQNEWFCLNNRQFMIKNCREEENIIIYYKK